MNHALLSASSSKMWLACTPQAVLSAEQDEETNPFMEEGTLAHELGEISVKYACDQMARSTYQRRLREIKKSEYYCEDMQDHIEKYVTHVLQRIEELEEVYGTVIVYIEKKLDYSEYAPEGFGTGDIVLACAGAIEVIDLKYGRGIYVSAVENTQMMFYGLGALKELEIIFAPRVVHMTVYQPRKNNISSYYMVTGSLKAWGDSIKPIAEQAYKGTGPFNPGEHCTFCRVHKCRARSEHFARMEGYHKAPFLTDDEVRQVLDDSAMYEKFIKGLKGDVYKQIYVDQKPFAGYCVEEGRGRRYYVDELAIQKVLLANKYEYKTFIKEPALIGLTDMTKLLGKKQFDKLIGDLVVRNPGKMTLTKGEPKVKAVTAADDFAEVDFGD